MRTVLNLGIIGTTGGSDPGAVLAPLDLPLRKDGAVWDLTGYVDPELVCRDWHTKIPVAVTGTVTIEDAPNGVVRYTPAVADPLYAAAGTYEARVYVRPGAGQPYEMSGRFLYSIEDSP